MKRIFNWYWNHIKSAYSFGGYVHPLSKECTNFWREEWRATKSLFIVMVAPQVVIFALLFLLVGVILALQQLGIDL